VRALLEQPGVDDGLRRPHRHLVGEGEVGVAEAQLAELGISVRPRKKSPGEG